MLKKLKKMLKFDFSYFDNARIKTTMHALRQYTGFTGLLTGLWRNRVQHHLADIVFVHLAYVSVKLKKQNKINISQCKVNDGIQKVCNRASLVGRYQEKGWCH